MRDIYDVIIIGGGVVGCMTARQLSRYRLKVLLIEKESDIGMGPSSANSAIIHAGHDPIPGSLKAEMNSRANPMWDQVATELDIAFERRGSYIVAIGTEERTKLDGLYARGRQNGVPGMEILSAAETLQREPQLSPEVSGALWLPTAGIVDTFGAVIAAAENALQNGVKLLLETEFQNFLRDGRRIVGVRTNRGDFGCRWAINAAGLFSDVVMHKAGVRPDFKITPRRGEYCVLDRTEFTTRSVYFPVPGK